MFCKTQNYKSVSLLQGLSFIHSYKQFLDMFSLSKNTACEHRKDVCSFIQKAAEKTVGEIDVIYKASLTRTRIRTMVM